MPDDLIAPTASSVGKAYISRENMELGSRIALLKRVQAGEIMTYHLDGWVVREYPGSRIVKLAPVGQFRSEDHPIEV